MSGKLEKFIKENRGQMDDLVPSEKLWAGISTGIAGGSVLVFFKSKLAWLKLFGFGASAVAIAVATYAYLTSSDHESSSKKGKSDIVTVANKAEEVNSDKNQVIAVDSPKVEKKVAEAKVEIPVVKSEDKVKELKKQDTMIALPNRSLALASSNVTAPVAYTSGGNAVQLSAAAASSITNLQSNCEIKGNETRDTLLKDVDHLVLIACCADVVISANQSQDVHMKASFSTTRKGMVKEAEYKLGYTRAGKSMTITLSNTGKNQVIIGSLVINNILQLEVPESIDIKTRTASGNTTVNNLKGKSKDFNSSSGDIVAQNIDGDMRVTTAHGNVNIKNMRGNLEVKVTSGDTKVSELTGNIKCGSAFGNSSLSNVKGEIKMASTSGGILVKNAEGNAHISSSHGNITFENYKGNPELAANSGDINGKNVLLLEKMTAKSAFGNINMQLNNPMKDLSFHAKSTHGMISIDKDGEKAKISGSYFMNNGKIVIQSETVSGDQYYK